MRKGRDHDMRTALSLRIIRNVARSPTFASSRALARSLARRTGRLLKATMTSPVRMPPSPLRTGLPRQDQALACTTFRGYRLALHSPKKQVTNDSVLSHACMDTQQAAACSTMFYDA